MPGATSPAALGRALILVGLGLCMALIVVSTIMHLQNVGMGGPDWPDSYGRIEAGERQVAQQGGHAEPAALIPTGLAERVHRAVASALQLLILAVFVLQIRNRRRPGHSALAAGLALAVSLFLAMLGMGFGSPLRYPWIVIIDVLGGIALLALFWWLTLRTYARARPIIRAARPLRPWAMGGLAVVFSQIALGGWIDAYYGALACTGFPECAGPQWSGADLLRGFALLGTLEVDASGTVVVDQSVAAAVHMAHRMSAVLVALFVGWLGWRAARAGAALRPAAGAILGVLAAQVGLGAAMVLVGMPMGLVAAHRVLAALLVLSIVALIYRLSTE